MTPGGDGKVDRPDRRLPGGQVRAVHAVVRELDPGKRAAVVDPFRDALQRGKIAVIPDTQLDERGDIRGWVDLHLLGADDCPAALGLDSPQGGFRGGIPVAHAGAVRHLEEPVPGGDRPDLDRLEEDIMPGVPHVLPLRHGPTRAPPRVLRDTNATISPCTSGSLLTRNADAFQRDV